jgi:hypothetical protein
MKRFRLYRKEDETGISGTGYVSEGIQFSSGKCAMNWTTTVSSVAVYDSIEELEAIHGHNGMTEVRWMD